MAEKSSINLLKSIRDIKDCELIFFFTYTFDPIFFDNSIFKILKRHNPNAIIVVFLEYSTYIKKGEDFTDSTGKEYLLLPVKVGSFFHPKVFFFYKEKEPISFVGSHNLTLPGLSHNMEISSEINDSATNLDILKFISSTISDIIKDKENFLIQKLGEIIKSFEEHENENIKFLTNRKIPILNQVCDLLKKEDFNKLIIFSPFFSKTNEILDVLSRELGIDEFTFCLQKNNHTLDINELKGLKRIQYQEVKTPDNRRLHFKILHFKGKENEYLVIGSPNFTKSALLKTMKGGNLETCLLIRGIENINQLFNELECRPISSEDVESSRSEHKFEPIGHVFDNVISFCFLNKITNQIEVFSNTKEELKITGKLFDGTELELKSRYLADGLFKIPIHDEKYPMELWFIKDGKTVSNQARIFYNISTYDMFPQYKNKPKELNKIFGKLSDISSMVRILYTLFGDEKERTPRDSEKGGRELHPSPGKLSSKHKELDIFSFLQDLLRFKVEKPERGKSEPPKPGEKKEPPEPARPVYHKPDVLKEIDNVFDKITINFAEKVLVKDNSLPRYIQYLLICLWFQRYFERELHLKTGRYYVRMIRDLDGLIWRFNIGKGLSKQDFFDLLFLLINTIRRITDNSIRGITTIEHILLPFRDIIISLFYKTLDHPDILETLNTNSELYGFRPLNIDKVKTKYLPEFAGICINQSKGEKKFYYIKKLMYNFFEADDDPRILLFTILIMETSKNTSADIKNLVREVVLTKQKSVKKRFKKICLEDIKKSYRL